MITASHAPSPCTVARPHLGTATTSGHAAATAATPDMIHKNQKNLSGAAAQQHFPPAGGKWAGLCHLPETHLLCAQPHSRVPPRHISIADAHLLLIEQAHKQSCSKARAHAQVQPSRLADMATGSTSSDPNKRMEAAPCGAHHTPALRPLQVLDTAWVHVPQMETPTLATTHDQNHTSCTPAPPPSLCWSAAEGSHQCAHCSMVLQGASQRCSSGDFCTLAHSLVQPLRVAAGTSLEHRQLAHVACNTPRGDTQTALPQCRTSLPLPPLRGQNALPLTCVHVSPSHLGRFLYCGCMDWAASSLLQSRAQPRMLPIPLQHQGLAGLAPPSDTRCFSPQDSCSTHHPPCRVPQQTRWHENCQANHVWQEHLA
jgi:hypothetical protein